MMLVKNLKDKKKRKIIIALIILINVTAFINFWYAFYGRKQLFDTTKHATVDCNQITKIEIKDGYWKWEDKEWPSERDSKLIITDRKDINLFCSALNSSKAIYIDNIRADFGWLDIYFTENRSEHLKIRLKINFQKETFIEYNESTFEGEAISNAIKTIANKYGR